MLRWVKGISGLKSVKLATDLNNYITVMKKFENSFVLYINTSSPRENEG